MKIPIRSYRDLVVWQKAVELVTEIYRLTQSIPKEEKIDLMSQMRRAAVSIPSNIAEGHGRLSRKEYIYFLGNARGSLAELETQVTIARNLGFLEETKLNRVLEQAGELCRIKNGLLASLRK